MSQPQKNSLPPNTETPSPRLQPPAESFVDRKCVKHGTYAARQMIVVPGMEPITIGCPTCQAETDVQDELNAKRAEKRMRAEKLKELLTTAAIPPKYAAVKFDDYLVASHPQRVVKAICETFAKRWPEQYDKGGCLILTGLVGTGKTMLACAIANAVMANFGATVAFGMLNDLLREVKLTFRPDSRKTEKQALAELASPDLLILDEVGLENDSEFAKRTLFDIVYRRYHANRPTILISNFTGVELQEYLGERTWRRFDECGPVLALDWPRFDAKGGAA